MKNIVFHPYALYKMNMRNLSRSTVLETVAHLYSVIDGKYGRRIAQKVHGDHLVRVVFEEHEDHLPDSDCIPVETGAVSGGVQMMIKYFKDIDVLNIELHEGGFGYSEEIAEGVIFDISQEGKILSIEVLDVAKKFHKPAVERVFEKYVVRAPPTMV